MFNIRVSSVFQAFKKELGIEEEEAAAAAAAGGNPLSRSDSMRSRGSGKTNISGAELLQSFDRMRSMSRGDTGPPLERGLSGDPMAEEADRVGSRTEANRSSSNLAASDAGASEASTSAPATALPSPVTLPEPAYDPMADEVAVVPTSAPTSPVQAAQVEHDAQLYPEASLSPLSPLSPYDGVASPEGVASPVESVPVEADAVPVSTNASVTGQDAGISAGVPAAAVITPAADVEWSNVDLKGAQVAPPDLLVLGPQDVKTRRRKWLCCFGA